MLKSLASSALFMVILTSCAFATTPVEKSTFPSPTDIPNNEFLSSRYTSTLFGISFLIPEQWHVDEDEYGITITTDPSLQIEDNLSFADGEAIILLMVTNRVEDQPYDESTMIDVLNDLPPYLPPGKERAHIIILNGKAIAFAGYGTNKPIPYPSFTAMTLLDKKIVLGLIFTSISNERSFRRLFQDMVASIENVDVP